MQNLGQLLKECAQDYRECIAYEMKRGFRTERYSFADVYTLSLKTATFLQQCQLKKGDTLAIWSPNMPEYPILYFGCWLLGIIVVPIDIRTTEETLQLFVAKAGCKLGFKSRRVAGPFPATVVSSYDLEDLIALVQEMPVLEAVPEVSPDDTAEIAFTSGTTGTPKGVVLTHRNFLANVSAFCATFPLDRAYRTLSLLPLSHAFEQVIDFLMLFQAGITVVYLERINQVAVARALRKHAITSVAIVPQLLQLLLSGMEREVERSGKQNIWDMLHRVAPLLPMPVRRLLFAPIRYRLGKHLQFFGCGSALLNRKLARKWENLGIAIYEGYGATETTALLTINTPSAKRTGSVGKVLPGVHLCIDSQTHEIMARGPNVSSGYFQDCEKTRQTFVSGWYRTGDIGTCDADGYLYITGREGLRIVLPDGEKVYPEDIENKLNAHPLVRESCVLGVHGEGGERVHAVVITRHPRQLDVLIRQVNQQLSSHEQILAWSLWTQEDFPRTPMLKIDRAKVVATIGSQAVTRAQVQVSDVEDKLIFLIAQIARKPASRIRETDIVTTDLALDSLQRVELLSCIEQDLGVAIAETEVTEHTTVAQLRELIQQAEVVPSEPSCNELNYSPLFVRLRTFLQRAVVFPLHAFFVPLQVVGQENLAAIELPAIFYFNHVGIMDAVCALRVLPAAIRQKLAITMTHDLWKEWRRPLVEFWGGGYPFDTRQNIKASLERTGEFLDRGFSLMIAPEGEISPDGTLQPFKAGIGFMAMHMHVPAVPIKIDPAYREIFPAKAGTISENFPKKRKCIEVKIGRPLYFSGQLSIAQATEEMRQAMIAL